MISWIFLGDVIYVRQMDVLLKFVFLIFWYILKTKTYQICANIALEPSIFPDLPHV